MLFGGSATFEARKPQGQRNGLCSVFESNQPGREGHRVSNRKITTEADTVRLVFEPRRKTRLNHARAAVHAMIPPLMKPP